MWHVAAQTIVEPNQAQLCYPDVNIVSSTSKSKLTEKKSTLTKLIHEDL